MNRREFFRRVASTSATLVGLGAVSVAVSKDVGAAARDVVSVEPDLGDVFLCEEINMVYPAREQAGALVHYREGKYHYYLTSDGYQWDVILKYAVA